MLTFSFRMYTVKVMGSNLGRDTTFFDSCFVEIVNTLVTIAQTASRPSFKTSHIRRHVLKSVVTLSWILIFDFFQATFTTNRNKK